MGLKIAVANGNWSNPATWNAGTLPQPGDIVASNNFTVTIDQNVNVDFITNTAQTAQSIIPFMTSNTAPSGTASTNNFFGVGYEPFRAFDGSVSGASNHWLTQNNPVFPWLQYEFPTAKTIVAYSIETNFNNIPNTWEFQAWNGTAWVTLDTVSGRTSNSLLLRTFTNTTSYSRYRLYITAVNGTNACVGELRLFDDLGYSQNSVAGGGFVLTNGVSVTCTTALRSGNSTLLLWSGTSGNTITSPLAVGAGSGRLIDVAGVGTLNINITTLTGIGGVAPTLVHVGAAATVNIVGTFQVVSDLRGTMLNIAAAATVNVTGSFIRNVYTNNPCYTIGIVAPNSLLNITGDIIVGPLSNYWGYEWNITSVYNINITGSLQTILTPFADVVSIFSSVAGYLKVIGPIITYGNHVVYRNTNNSAINLFSGPFVCSTYGYVPLQVTRMHLIPSTSSYIEFRDETTNGALSPGAIATATRMVSPASAVDAPATSNVRLGVTYANGSQIGTLNMPPANTVAAGVEVDNTVGSAVLSPASVWDALLSTMNTAGSIGERLKNAATVETTGAQIASFNS